MSHPFHRGWRLRGARPGVLVGLVFVCCHDVPPFDGARAHGYLLAQCAMGHRAPNSDGHERCRRYLVQFFRDRTPRVTEQAFAYTDRLGITLNLCNIIASFRPTEGKRVLLAAHWDTRPRADRDPDPLMRDLPILGANDGASGVAVLMEVANAMVSHPPPMGVDIVLFDGEDYGEEGQTDEYLLGSRHFVATTREYRPRWAVVVDMVGDADLDIFKERVSLVRAPAVVEMIWEEAARQGASSFHPWPGHTVMDDHWPLLEMGIPCIDIIDFDYPYWHTHADRPERCSARSLAEVGRVVLGVIY